MPPATPSLPAFPDHAALTRDRGRLLRLLGQWRKAPADGSRQAAYEKALADSMAARERRAAQVPTPTFDDTLPVAREAEALVALIRKHPVVVVAGETGSGKTTQLPKICLAAGRGQAGMVGCTQPRRIAARAVARRVAEELRSPMGGAVGYQVRFTENVGDGTYVKFMTDGILLAEIQSDRWLSKYDTIIVDEAHERSLNIDFLLGYLKQLVRKRPDLKLVITSATIDTERFAKHFDGAPVVSVEGRSFPVEVRYRPGDEEGQEERGQVHFSGSAAEKAPRPGRKSEPDPVLPRDRPLAEAIVAAADEITREDPQGDVLVFLPGEREIRDAHAALNRRKYRSTEVIPLYARLSVKDQDKVFNPGPGRRIVLATNVAETSLTVPRIRYVIDPGLARVKRYSPRGKLDRLHIEPVSQASADQRKGRCGRIAAGICYRLYSQDDFDTRPRYTDPEILRASLAGVILRMLTLGLGRVEDFPFIDPPDPRAIADGWQTLAELGAVDEQRQLTAIGRQMARLPVDVKLARMLVAAQALGCLADMTVITSFLGIQDPRERPADAREKADNAHAEFADPNSEFVGILKLWEAHHAAHEDLTQSKLRDWCERRYLAFLRMREWRELHRQLLLACEEIWPNHSSGAAYQVHFSGHDRASKPDQIRKNEPGTASPKPGPARKNEPGTASQATQNLHRALIAGLPSQIGHRTEKGLYDAPRQRRFQLFPGSSLSKLPPAWVLVATLLDTQKVWGMTAARIEPDWVIAELPHLLARKHFDPHWSRRQGRVIGSEQVSLFGLVLAPKRPVHYGGLYPAESREIFVRQGLVPGEVDTRSPFLKRNLATLEKAREEEAKLRRAGLVADEDWQARWYLDRLPPELNSVAGLDSWYGKLPPEQKKSLEWSLADLLPGEGSEAERFPKYFALGDARLALHYRFEPGHAEDGVTLDLPLHLLMALDATRIGWLVPGLVEEKATALIRGLPKALRRNYVPAPDFARAFAEAHPAAEADALAGTLARFLTRATGAPVAALDFDEAALDPHLRMNLRLADRDGRVLAQSRDLAGLRARFGEQAERAFAERAGEALARDGLVRFPDQPVPREVPGAAGVPAFPALVDAGDSVALSVFADPSEAARAHDAGVRRLVAIALADKLRQARKQLPVTPKLALLYAAIEGFAQAPGQAPAHEHLRADLAEAALQAVLAGDFAGIRDADAFRRVADDAGRRLFPEAMARLQLAEAILGAVAGIKPRLESPLLGWASGNLDDLKAQLAGLVPPGFLRETPPALLAEYPRYLKALALRSERALRDPQRDQARMLELKPFQDALLAARRDGRDREPAWQALRHDLEELRVSVFAQELGTRRQVSAKRLARQLEALTRAA